MRPAAPLAFTLALLLAASIAPPASAGTALVNGTTVRFEATRAEENNVTVYADRGPGLVVEDERTNLVAGAGCTTVTPRRVRCGDAQILFLSIDLGPANDHLTVRDSVPVAGELFGGAGNDMLRGSLRRELIVGGRGGDTASYIERAQDVAVTLGGGADDGAAGEGDDIREVEGVIGGNGFDTLVGGIASEQLLGGPGDDRLDGGEGNDRLTGGAGQDLLQGGVGADVFVATAAVDGSDAMHGGPGIDRADYGRRDESVSVDPDGIQDDGERPNGDLAFTGPLPPLALLGSPERDNVLPDVENVGGGDGADVLAPTAAGGRVDAGGGTDIVYGGPGRDILTGGSGFDRMVSRDRQPDTVNCGPRVDRVHGNNGDVIAGDCEQRLLAFRALASPVTRRLTDEGLAVRVACPAQAFRRCAGTVSASTVRRVRTGAGGLRRPLFGRARYLAQPGTSPQVVIPFSAEARALAAELSPVRLRLVVRG
ncbi:MAG TPA: calcium-binding protein, partial [Solirubrobacteraceae bacterium]|nr:calcium-binding protein [Solirubrobacteraceae bacterium]